LDLGARHIAYCEVRDGKVVERVAVQRLEQLASRLGPGTPPARVAFEAAREAWHVYDVIKEWGHDAVIVDTTRLKKIGIGEHKRKNDAIDAEHIAIAVEQERIPRAHVLSEARRELRKRLSIRKALVETRAQYVTTIRGIARGEGVLLPTCTTQYFVPRLEEQKLEATLVALIRPLVEVLKTIEQRLSVVEDEIAVIAEGDALVQLCATAPGVGVTVAATYLSIIDEPKRFKSAQAVGAYLGLVPSESTTGGNRRLGSITKQGNTHARVALIQAAWAILRARHHASDPIHIWGTRIAKRRGKSIAAVAIARRLAGVLWAMCRDGTPYDAATEADRSAAGVRRRAVDDRAHAAALERVSRKLRRRSSLRKVSEVVTM
jgi:transposase